MMVSFLPRAVDMIDDDRYQEVVFGRQSGRRKEAESIRGVLGREMKQGEKQGEGDCVSVCV
jgi:hypothetical protein